MRAPTIPEAHLAAVILSTVLAWSWVGYFAWHHPGYGPLLTPLVFIPFGIWLRFAWLTMKLQHRVAKAYAEQMQQATGLPAATMTPEDLRRALGVEGRPATRPVAREEQAE